MKLYNIRDEDKILVHFCLDYEDPKTHIKENCSWMNADLRTLKQIEFPKGRFECSNLDHFYCIFYNGEPIVSWNDNANSDYPEDLCWSRDISLLIEQVEKLKELEFKDRSGE